VNRLWVTAAVSLTVAGCTKEPSVVGTWTGNLPNLPSVTMDLKENKTMTLKAKVPPYSASFSGKYEADSKTLTLTFDKGSVSGLDPSMKEAGDVVIKGLLNKPFKLAYHFNNANELALTYNARTDVVKRVVENK